MYYIDPTANESGNHGNPMGQPFPGCVGLPEELLADYLAGMGFVHLTIVGEEVTGVVTNEEALAAYQAAHPAPQAPPEPPKSNEELTKENHLLQEQVAALTERNSFHEDLIAEMASVVYT